MHACGPGALVGVGVRLGQPGRVQLRVQVAAEPALAALPRLCTKGGAAWPAAARHAEVAVDLAVMRPAAPDRMCPGYSVWQRIEALPWMQVEHRGVQRTGGVGLTRVLGDKQNGH